MARYLMFFQAVSKYQSATDLKYALPCHRLTCAIPSVWSSEGSFTLCGIFLDGICWGVQRSSKLMRHKHNRTPHTEVPSKRRCREHLRHNTSMAAAVTCPERNGTSNRIKLKNRAPVMRVKTGSVSVKVEGEVPRK